MKIPTPRWRQTATSTALSLLIAGGIVVSPVATASSNGFQEDAATSVRPYVAGSAQWFARYENPTEHPTSGGAFESPENLQTVTPQIHDAVASVTSNFSNLTSSSESIVSLLDRNPDTKWYSGSALVIVRRHDANLTLE